MKRAIIYMMIGFGVYAGEAECGRISRDNSWGCAVDLVACVAAWPVLLSYEAYKACITVNEGRIEDDLNEKANETEVTK